ncbi:hypothetical protein NH26_04665 [Flammeovirga pacifica]|uniref:DUF4384 domain-containing protein n=2 Tax=Flammeovirga pacifica TaxID=915059 RepID=A0A1S1YXH2_FLAPC|nr:hypothetical protein NH26_04665 [Flammeovirga pacifica]
MANRHKLFLSLIFMAIPFFNVCQAQKLKKISGKVTEPINENISIKEFKQELKMKAQIQALADEFGTLINSNSDLTLNNQGTTVNMLSSSNVKGEWVKTTEISFKWFLEEVEEKQKVYLSCEIKGKAREITKSKVDLDAQLLKCSNTNLCITQKFKEGESLYLSVKTPIDGYLSIFMREEGTVYRLLPYSNLSGNQNSCIKIEADKEYVLFDDDNEKAINTIQKRYIDELQLSTMGKDKLFNRLYVVFSTSKYDKPILNTDNGIKTLSPESFQEWISNNKLSDENFQDQVIYFTVEQ